MVKGMVFTHIPKLGTVTCTHMTCDPKTLGKPIPVQNQSSATLVRAEHASFITTSNWEAKLLSVSKHDSLVVLMPSWGFCPVPNMKGDEHVDACTQSL